MAYSVKLEKLNFDGPLDLLLHLIEKAKIDIQDIFVSDITEQYLEHLRMMESMDMELTSDFIETAALLLEVKSKSLLPVDKNIPEEENPEQVLMRRLAEYRAFKEAAEEFSERGKILEGAVFRRQMESEVAQRVEIDTSLDALMKAFDQLVKRLNVEKNPPLRDIRKDQYTVNTAIQNIWRRMKAGKQTLFADLFESDTREEIVVTFIAILELWRLGKIALIQEEIYGDILLSLTEQGVRGFESGSDH